MTNSGVQSPSASGLYAAAIGSVGKVGGGENKGAIAFASTAGIFEAALGIVRAAFELFEPVEPMQER